MRVVIDRFEGKYAVCEKDDGSFENIKKDIIPIEAKEGDVLDINGDMIIINVLETKKKKSDIEKLVEDLWN